MQDTIIIPYIKQANGEYPLSDDIMRELWFMMVEQDLVGAVFFDGSVMTSADFLKFVKTENRTLLTIWDDKCLGFVWVVGVTGRCAMVHFCLFDNCRGKKAMLAGRAVISFLFDNLKSLMVLIGLLESENHLAISFVKRLGFTVLGEIPGMLCNIYLNNNGNATLVYLLREGE